MTNKTETPENKVTKSKSKKSEIVKVSIIALLVLILGAGAWALFLRETDQYADLSEQGRLDAAQDQLNQALASASGGDLESAIASAEEVVRAAPDTTEAWSFAGSIVEKEDTEEAKRYYVKALELLREEDNPDEDGKHPIIYVAAGEFAAKAGLSDEARGYFEKALLVADDTKSEFDVAIERATAGLESLE